MGQGNTLGRMVEGANGMIASKDRHERMVLRHELRLISALLLICHLIIYVGCGGGGGGTITARGNVDGYVYEPTTGSGKLVLSNQDIPPDASLQPSVQAQVAVINAGIADVTDSAGKYLLVNIPAGIQTLLVSKNGFDPVSLPLTVTANTTTTVPIERKWTVMVFLNADDDGSNSLETWAIDDINEMELSGSTDSVTILVQIDRIATGNDSSNGNWTDTRRYLVDYDPTFTPSQTLNGIGSGDRTIRSTRLDNQPDPLGNGVGLGELNMGAWETLRDFIEYGKSNYPAPNYAVVIWDHGSGIKDWGKRNNIQTQLRGVSFDDTEDEFIATHELDNALQSVAPLDIVAFDASLMQMVAVVNQIRTHTGLVVGSEKSPPGEGFPYHRWLSELVNNPFMTSEQLATTICQEATAEVGGKGGESTQSALRTAQLSDLSRKIDAFANLLRQHKNTYASELQQARDEAKSYADLEFKDLYHYAERVKTRVNNVAIQDAATDVQTAIQLAMLINETANISNSNGVSIWIPEPSGSLATSNNMDSYKKNDLAITTQWDEWLIEQIY